MKEKRCTEERRMREKEQGVEEEDKKKAVE